ncbi:MAG: Ger(x)C family spore germination protein [Firmicutes bacterium]|nr:Ger(x)C family spore germination protein [Bacillota bacterium]
MKNKLKALKILVFILIVVTLSFRGWSSSRDIEKRSFVLTQGVDTAPDNTFSVTYSLANPQALGNEEGGGSKGKESAIIYKTRCRNLWQGHHFIQARTEHPLFLGHVQTLVLGEELARQGIGRVVDVFMRAAETRLKTWLVVAEGEAGKILEVAPKPEKLAPLYIGRALEMEDYLNVIPLLRVAEFGIRLRNPGEHPVAPMVKAGDDELALTGLALFKDDKMVGKLNHEEMHYFFLTVAGKGHMFKRVETSAGDTFSYEISNVKRRVRLHRTGDQVSFSVLLAVEGNIVEAVTERSLRDMEFLASVEQVITEALAKDCRALLTKIQTEFQVDSFGFGAMVRGRYPKLWAQLDWDQDFPTVPIKITLDATIRRLGMVSE